MAALLAATPCLAATELRGTPLAVSRSSPGAHARVASRPGAVRASKREGSERNDDKEAPRDTSRRELIMQTSSIAMLASVFSFSGTRPSFVGVKNKQLALCPSTPNCISTAEELNDPAHYVPPWSYNPEDGRGKKNPATQEQAMEELVSVVKSTKPDNFEPTIIEQRPDYLYVEYASNLFGFVDDVEFFFPQGPGSLVEYRSASRLGESDFDINRKRIKALRVALQKYGWASVGF